VEVVEAIWEMVVAVCRDWMLLNAQLSRFSAALPPACYTSCASINLKKAMEIQFTTRIFKEGRAYVAHAMELDVSSCGGSKEKALRNLKEAVALFLEEAEKMGTLDQILEEADSKGTQKIAGPKFISVQRVTLPLPLTHAKA
jgi:predicted RNase H-like HicB family nuclease